MPAASHGGGAVGMPREVLSDGTLAAVYGIADWCGEVDGAPLLKQLHRCD